MLSGSLIVQTGQRHAFLDDNREVIHVAYSGNMVGKEKLSLVAFQVVN